MARKSTPAPKLDPATLTALGAERLAELLFDCAQTDTVLKRKLKFEIAMAGDPAAAAREVEKRIASLSRAKAYVDWPKVRAFAHDLDSTREVVAERLAKAAPAAAYDLLWSFMETAETTHERCDDSNGGVGDVYALALRDLASLARQIAQPVEATVGRMLAAIETNGYGQFDGIIELFAPALGKEGLALLRGRLREALAEAEDLANRTPEPEMRRINGIPYMRAADMEGFRPKYRVRTLNSALRDVASAQGDVDAYIAAIESDARSAPGIAVDIARRLLDAGRPAEALAALDAVEMDGYSRFAASFDDVRFDTLEALGRGNEAQAARWASFQRSLSAQHLKDYLSRLPDFDDFEAERKALDHAESFEDKHEALHFLVGWPALERASRLVLRHTDKWNGDLYELLSPSADALDEKYPLAATVLRRAMIEFTLTRARSSRYGHAARHLRECQALRSRIEDYAPIADHETYVADLRKKHGRKSGFWQKFEG